jgi:hypothetical protein
VVAGIVAITYPYSSIDASARPMARSSSVNARSRISCLSVLGTWSTFRLDWVS